MSEEPLRDGVMTLFLAGHETTANALGWTIYLLTQLPDIAERLVATTDDLESELLRNVAIFTVRLYPAERPLGA